MAITGDKKTSRRKRILLVIAAAVILLFSGFAAFLHTRAAGSWLLRLADRTLRKTAGYSLEAGSIRFRPFGLIVKLEEVTVKAVDPEGVFLQAFTAEKVEVEAAWSSVFGKKIRIRKVVVVRPEIKARFPAPRTEGPEKQPSSAPPAAEAPGTSEGWDLRIDAFDLLGGAFMVDGGSTPFGLSLSGIKADLRYDPAANLHTGRLEIGEGRGVLKSSRLDILEAGVFFRFDGETVSLERFRLTTPASFIEASGSAVPFGPEPEFQIAARGSLSLEEFLPFAAAPVLMKGGLEISAEIKGCGNDISYTGRIDGRELSLPDLGPATFTAAIEGNAASLRLSGSSFRSAAGNLEAEADVCLATGGISRIEARWNDVVLHRFAALLPAEWPLIAATSDGWIQACWHFPALKDVSAKAEIRLAAAPLFLAADSRPVLAPSGRVVFEASPGRLFGKGVLSAVSVRLAFEGSVERMRDLDTRIYINIPDFWAAARALAGSERLAAVLPPGFPPLPEEGGSTNIRGRIQGRIDDPRAALTWEADGIDWDNIHLSGIRASAEAGRRGIDVERFSAGLNGGVIEGSGKIAFREGTIKPGPGTQFSMILSKLGLEPIAALLPEGLGGGTGGMIEGKAEVTLDDAGFQANFKAVLAPLSVRGVPFTRASAEGRFANGKIDVDSLSLESETCALTGRFGLDIPGGTFHASLKGDRIPLDIASPFLPSGTPLEGTVRVVMEGEGPFAKPRFTLSVSLENLAAWGFRLPRIDLDASSNGSRATSVLIVPSLNLRVEAGLVLEAPYIFQGKLLITEAPVGSILAAFASSDPGAKTDAAASLSAEVSFAYPVMDPENFRADGAFSARDAGVLASRLPGWPPETSVAGAFEGRFSVRGDPKDIEQLETDVEIPKLELSIAEVFFANREMVRLRLRDGRALIDGLTLASDRSEVGLSGTVSFGAEPVVDGRIRAAADLIQFDPLVPEARIGGRFEADLAVKGNLAHPGINGRIEVRDGFARVRDFPLALAGINGTVEFNDTEAVIPSFRGAANGGSFAVEGRINHGGFTRAATDGIRLTLRDFNLDFPPGFRTVSEADLVLQGDWGKLRLSGEARVLRGLYREDIHPGIELLSLARYRPNSNPEDIPPLIRDVRLDIGLSTVEPLRVRNNLADIELEGRLRLSGTPAFPLLSGRVRNTGVGKAILGDRRYTIETAVVEYLGEDVLSFSIDVVAHTRLRHKLEDLDIRLHLSGPISKPTYSLTSEPSRSSEELSFILLTGKSLEEIRGSALDTLGGQMIQYFTTPLTSPVTQGLKNLLKAEDVTIEPLNIASEEDPGARFTFRKRVSDRAAVTYSADITRSQRQTWILDFDLSRSFALSAYRKDDGSYGSSFKHSFSIGGRRAAPRTAGLAALEHVTLVNIAFEGTPIFPAEDLEAKIKSLRPGQPFSYSDLSTAVDSLLGFYKDRGYANVVVDPRVSPENEGGVAVVLDVTAGMPVSFLFSGDAVPSSLKKKVREIWSGDFPEEANLAESRAVLLDALWRKRHYSAEVVAESKEIGNRIFYVFTTRKRDRYHIRRFTVESGGPLTDMDVKRTVSDYPMAPMKGLWNLVFDTRSSLAALERRLEDLGFRKADIRSPLIESDPASRSLDIQLHIDPGPRSLVRNVLIEGLDVFERTELESVLALLPGRVFSPTRLQEDRNAVLTLYRSAGYKDADVTVRVASRSGEDDVDILYEIREGKKHVLAKIEVAGNPRTKDSFILREAGLIEGAPINLETFARSQKRLYDTGVFRGVNIFGRPAAGDEDGETVVIEVEEAPPISATYGLRYNSEEKIEGFGELSFTSLFGGGRKEFLSYRENRRRSDLRFSLRSPYLFGIRFNTLLSLYAGKDIRDYFVTEEKGVSVQQEVRLPLDFTLFYLYRLNRLHTYELEASGPFAFDFTILLSEVALNLVRDTRDDKLNPRSGSFFSASLTYAPEYLGSDLTYVSFYTQYSEARHIGGRVVWSSGLRLGLADAFDQVLIPSRRFFAGGGNSIRGFKLDALGPLDPYLGRPEGGEAVLIVNNEIRFPLFKSLGGAVFYDFGNVYATPRNLSLSDLRHGAGVGLRVNSLVGLVRLDLGFNLSPRPGESRTSLFFSLGQAF
jgi:outer membrane protein assembly complex protein YaeT